MVLIPTCPQNLAINSNQRENTGEGKFLVFFATRANAFRAGAVIFTISVRSNTRSPEPSEDSNPEPNGDRHRLLRNYLVRHDCTTAIRTLDTTSARSSS